MWMIAANFRRTHSSSRLAWSEGWRPPGAQSTSDELDELSKLLLLLVVVATSDADIWWLYAGCSWLTRI